MAVLTKEKILKEMARGRIKIEPFSADQIGPASIDLTLGDKFRIFKETKAVDITDTTDYQNLTNSVIASKITLKPGETVLGVTREKITLAPNICGLLEGRSRFARCGLMVHISASFMQPGISNHQVLELSNMSKSNLVLHSGTKICQFIFQKTLGRAKYSGKFKDQREP